MTGTVTSAGAQSAERYRVTRRVTLIGSVVDVTLGVAKVTVGSIAQSQALIADGIHSLSDLATDIVVLIAAHHANQEADDEHPYGHARFETLATVVLGLFLIAVGAALAADAVRRMLNPELLLSPEPWAIWVAAVSVISKEWVYRYTIAAARRVRSKLLEANAWHSRSDAISSLVVIAGIGGTMAGLEDVDAVAAIVVAWMIARIGWDFALQSVRDLVDTGLDEDTLEAIREVIHSVDGVGSLHELRTRRMGSTALVDVHLILADSRVSVSEGHQISEVVRSRIVARIDDVADVMVHIDPEDDEISPTRLDLPGRAELSRRLHERWHRVEGAERIRSLRLHYLRGKVDIEIWIDPVAAAPLANPQRLLADLRAASAGETAVGDISLVALYDAP
jgi:cation diffusion facilitator family transporter